MKWTSLTAIVDICENRKRGKGRRRNTQVSVAPSRDEIYRPRQYKRSINLLFECGAGRTCSTCSTEAREKLPQTRYPLFILCFTVMMRVTQASLRLFLSNLRGSFFSKNSKIKTGGGVRLSRSNTSRAQKLPESARR